MTEALISSVLDQLASIFRLELEQDIRLVVGVHKQVRNLTSTLTRVRAVLADAEMKQFKNGAVKLWLEELKILAYDADDILDEWHTRILISQSQSKLVTSHGSRIATKVLSFLSSPCYCFHRAALRHDIAHRIRDIRERLDAIAKDKDQLNLIKSQSRDREEYRQITTSFVDISEICGRDVDRNVVANNLVQDMKIGVTVVAIVGMAGLGKTTLAQTVYKEEKVCSAFDLKMWVCVSDPFDFERVVKDVIEQATPQNIPNVVGRESLQQHLFESVRGKRFLLVLDDVWTEDPNQWNSLKLSLVGGAQGSRVLVTTRSELVAKAMGSTFIHRLEQLSDEDCWLLFRGVAFYQKQEEDHHKFEDIGKELALKCKGVPLAAKTLASLMQRKKSKQDWRSVLESEFWEVQDPETGFLPALLLSYNALPSYLKQCFMYCAIFPKDKVIEKDELVKLWMAQGFLGSDGTKELEMNGGNNFDDLAMRSFFQNFEKNEDGDIIKCKMHDLVHDFAQFLGKNECYILEQDNKDSVNNKSRHINAWNTECPAVHKANKLRTLILRSPEPALSELFAQLTCLRAFDVSGYYFLEELPIEVERLLHLRYLDMSGTRLRELPETMSNLHNLQTLKLNRCRSLRKLPDAVRELMNLRNMELEETRELSYFPEGISRLGRLRTLSKFIVSSASGGCRIEELGNLNFLRCSVEIIGLRQVEDEKEAKQAELQKKKNLRFLKLDFGYLSRQVNDDLSRDDMKRMEGVFEGLQPHNNLEELGIEGYPGLNFPIWISSESLLSNIVTLRLYKCKQCTHLPVLGNLESLENLEIIGLVSVKFVGVKFLGILDDNKQQTVFPRLRKLVLEKMEMWEEWDFPVLQKNNVEIMPELRELEMKHCPNLKKLPALGKLQSLEMLEISKILTVKHVSSELLGVPGSGGGENGASSLVLFPKLKKLTLDQLQEWEDRDGENQETGNTSIMPCLRTLKISGCVMLKAVPHYMFPQCLQELSITFCPQLTENHPTIPPLLDHLSLEGDVGVLSSSLLPITQNNNYPILKSVTIEKSQHSSLPQGLSQLTSLEKLRLLHCKFLDFKLEEELIHFSVVRSGGHKPQ